MTNKFKKFLCITLSFLTFSSMALADQPQLYLVENKFYIGDVLQDSWIQTNNESKDSGKFFYVHGFTCITSSHRYENDGDYYSRAYVKCVLGTQSSYESVLFIPGIYTTVWCNMNKENDADMSYMYIDNKNSKYLKIRCDTTNNKIN